MSVEHSLEGNLRLILAYCARGSLSRENRQSWKGRTEEVKSEKLKVTGGCGLFFFFLGEQVSSFTELFFKPTFRPN